MASKCQYLKNDRLTSWQPETKQELALWAIDRLSILAIALGEVVSPERLRIYAQDLVTDLSKEQLTAAFGRARRECKFFPKLAELREYAGAGKHAQCEDVEAAAAFDSVIKTLEREGVDFGIKHLPPTTQYAVRRCGGLVMFNQRLRIRYGDDDHPSQMDDRGPIFLQRDFAEASHNWTVHQQILPELSEKGIEALPPDVRGFLGPKRAEWTASEMLKREGPPVDPKPMPKSREPLTSIQVQDRRVLLRQQRAFLLEKRQGKTFEGTATACVATQRR
jgi:hypothetical protein